MQYVIHVLRKILTTPSKQSNVPLETERTSLVRNRPLHDGMERKPAHSTKSKDVVLRLKGTLST